LGTINSSQELDEKQSTIDKLLNDELDALIISPEQLANENIIDQVIQPISKKTGLLVIDEAHCISDLGHDFRPDYKRIKTILGFLPSNISVLLTTATANNRVMKDIESQFLGKHNFLSFSKFDIEKKNTICEIFKSKWTLKDGKLFYIIEGNRFLHHMVRYLVGTMIGCMEKKISSNDFLSLLENPIKDAKLLKAPAHGLILNKIFYEN
jgi:superfamily II DNA helicase RecQ